MTEALSQSTPPWVAGDVAIARHLSADSDGSRWRVSINGALHFLTDGPTAHKIAALAAPGQTYDEAFARYRAGGPPYGESREDFIDWCQRHRSGLDQLASTPDPHVMRRRIVLLGQHTCERLLTPFAGLYTPALMILLWCVSAACIVVFTQAHGIAPHGTGVSGALALALLGVAIHECGHVTACVRHGAYQGGIGAGLYWIWPVFFADVRGSWSLPARQRLQVSAGGLYFQSIYVAVLALLALATGNTTAAAAVHITLLLMATTLNPIFKFDGYWILSDICNVTNVHKKIAAHFRRLASPADGDRWRALRSPWTAVTAVFALAGTGYLAYVAAALTKSGAATFRAWYTALDAWPHVGWSFAGLSMQLVLLGVVSALFVSLLARTARGIISRSRKIA